MCVVSDMEEPNRVNLGVVYIATNNYYLDMVNASALSVLKHNPLQEITVLTNLRYEFIKQSNVNSCFIKCPTSLNSFQASRWLKTQLPLFTPYNRTLYLDADILAINNNKALWNFPNLSMALAYHSTIGNCQHINAIEKSYTLKIIGNDNFPQYNSGVMLFDKSRFTLDFFNEWHNQWLKYKQHDQLALSRAIYTLKKEIFTLPLIYNEPFFHLSNNTVHSHFSGSFQKEYFWEKFKSLNL